MANKPDSTKTTPVSLLRGDFQMRSRADDPVPPGQLKMVVTYLEMTKPPRIQHQSRRTENLSIIRTHRPTIGFYRYLYQAVGEDWLWYERQQMSDHELEQIITDPDVRIYVLYVNGTPAGYSEIDCRKPQRNGIELAYFGLIPDFIGRGLGGYFLRWSVGKAWSLEPKRLWVHTCNFDTPHAIATYQKAGFTAYKQETTLIDDPRLSSTCS